MRADQVTLTHGAIFRAARAAARSAGCPAVPERRSSPAPPARSRGIAAANLRGQTPLFLVPPFPRAKPAQGGRCANSAADLALLPEGVAVPAGCKACGSSAAPVTASARICPQKCDFGLPWLRVDASPWAPTESPCETRREPGRIEIARAAAAPVPLPPLPGGFGAPDLLVRPGLGPGVGRSARRFSLQAAAAAAPLPRPCPRAPAPTRHGASRREPQG